MPKLREVLALILIAVLPLHALLVTVGTRVMMGPMHAPWGVLAVWKEALLLVILILACIEIGKARTFTFDRLDLCVKFFIAVCIVVSLMQPTFNRSAFILGVRYDIVALLAFLILRRVSWSPWFIATAKKIILIVGSAVALYGLLTLVLPESFFTWIGYSDLHSLYVPNGPIAAFQKIESMGLRRMQSTFSGPNQMGLWLLLPLAIACYETKRARKKSFMLMTATLMLVLLAIALSFSRSAWIGAFAIFCPMIGAWGAKQTRAARRMLFVGMLIVLVVFGMAFEGVIIRASSSRDHFLRPLEAIGMMIAHPFGQGLGSAGPAQNRISDSCVMLPKGSDASWAKAHPALCVFVDDKQVQPAGRECQCPFLPENWYLQIGIEAGVLGMLLWIAITVIVLMALRGQKFLFWGFLALSITALFLHTWEDAALAFTMWMLIAQALPHKKAT